MKKKTGLWIAVILAVYALLLGLLTHVESSYGSSGIDSFIDALWYSLVTITTVGYGDLYPTSPSGRIIGVFFLMLSMGFLASLAGAVYSLLSGRLRPELILRIRQKRRWFIFSEKNAASDALAKDLEQQYPDSLFIFCGVSLKDGLHSCKNHLHLEEDIVQLLRRFGTGQGERTAFLISENELCNHDMAYDLRESSVKLYCLGREYGNAHSISWFDPFECCARQFWKTHPLRRDERCVLLVGDGPYAHALLSSALISNCRTPMLNTHYHMCGCWQMYLQDHHCLGQVFAIDCKKEGLDALFFHEGAWAAHTDLIAQADRIIFCFEDEDENARCIHQLERSFPCRASVYARTSHRLASGTRFGEAQAIYTAEFVMKRRLDRLAEQLHDQYCRMAPGLLPGWHELDAFRKASNRAAADHISTKIRLLNEDDVLNCKHALEIYRQASPEQIEICRKNEHERWMRFHSLHNWQYAPVRDNNARKHPSILPYEQLNESERAKDDFAWQQLEQLADAGQIQE